MKIFIKYLKHLFVIATLGYFVFKLLHYFEEINPIKKELSDFKFTDIYFGQFKDMELDNDIILVDVGKMGNSKTRKDITDFLNRIDDYNPKVIALDVDFKYDPNVPKKINQNLITALNKNDVVMYYDLQKENNVWYKAGSELDIDASKIKQGYSNNLVEKDKFGVLRFFQPFVTQGADTLKHFSIVIAEKFGVKIDQSFKENKKVMINFSYKFNDPRDLNDTSNLQIFKDKIVIVGLFTKINGAPLYNEDVHYTSSNKNYLGKSPPNMYGGEVVATIVSNIKQSSFIKYQKYLSFSLNILFSLIVYFLLLYMKTYYHQLYGAVEIIIKFVLVMLFILVSIFFISYKNIYIDFTMVGLVSFFAVEFVGLIDSFINFIENKVTKLISLKK